MDRFEEKNRLGIDFLKEALAGRVVKEHHGLWMNVTTDIANMLLKNVRVNRKVSPSQLRFLVKSHKDGEWEPSAMIFVIIGQDGNVQDAQHRLWMVAKSGKPAKMRFILGADPKGMDYIDSGKRRTLSDRLDISSNFPELKDLVAVDAVATAAAMKRGINKRNTEWSMMECGNFMMCYIDELRFVHDVCFPKKEKEFGTAAIRGIVARAAVGGEKERIKMFVDIFLLRDITGAEHEKNIAAKLTRLSIDEIGRTEGKGAGKGTKRQMITQKLQSGLKAFLGYKTLKQIKITASNVFPIS